MDDIIKYCAEKGYSFEVAKAMVEEYNKDAEFWQTMELYRLHDLVVYGNF